MSTVGNDCLGARAQVDKEEEGLVGFVREFIDISDGVGDGRDLVCARGRARGVGAGLVLDDILVVRCLEA